jgi:hypothetical protein
VRIRSALVICWSCRHAIRPHQLTAVAEPLIIVPRHIVLLTRDASLAVAVRALLDDGDTVTELESPQELPPIGELPVDGVVVDLPDSMRATTVERVRGRFPGPLVVLLGHGEDAAAARGVYRCAVLSRPFGMSQLWSVLIEESKTEVMPAIGGEHPFPGTALADGSPSPLKPDASPPDASPPDTPPSPPSPPSPRSPAPKDPAPPPEARQEPGAGGSRGPAVLPTRYRQSVNAIEREGRRSEATPGPAGGDAPAAAPKGDAVNVPAWNWRFRRFQPAPAGDDEVGERTEQMPAVTRPGNGLPPRVDRPPLPEAPPRDPVVGRAGEPAVPPAAQPSPAPGPAQTSPVPDAPEAVAGRLAERLRADAVALLLDNNRGLLEVAGGIGLTPAERQAQVEYGHEVLRELFRVGVGLIEDTDRVRGLIHGIPGARCQTLVMVPLVHEGHGFGALVIGRSDHSGKPRAEFTEAEIEALMDFAEDVAAPLRSTVLLRRLKGQLGSTDKG